MSTTTGRPGAGAVRLVPAVVQATKILRTISKAQQGLSVTVVSRETGISQSTCFNLLRTLAEEAQSIRDFDFSNGIAVNTGIEEVDELSIIMNEMKTTIRRFLEIGSSLTAERDLHSLLNRILREMVDVSRAVGGVIYLLEEDGSALRFETGRFAGDQIFDSMDEDYATRVPL